MAKGVKILDSVEYSPLFAPIPFDIWSQVSNLAQFWYYNHVGSLAVLFSNRIHVRLASACVADELRGLSKIILAALFCKTVSRSLRLRNMLASKQGLHDQIKA